MELWGSDPRVLAALDTAGWYSGRRCEIAPWVDSLEAAGFEISELAQRIWAEFGGLAIRSLPTRVPSSSLRIAPEDACIDCLDEAHRLRDNLRVGYSPLGMWSIQFRSYIGDAGDVIAVGPGVRWELGETFSSALEYVVFGDGGGSREVETSWLLPEY
jgi:hypothetical protein